MYWKEQINNLELELRKRKKELTKKYEECNNKQQDLLHAIEFEKYSASQGAKMLKVLKELRAERRAVDNELEEVKELLQRFSNGKLLSYTPKTAKKYTYRTDVVQEIIGKKKRDIIKVDINKKEG